MPPTIVGTVQWPQRRSDPAAPAADVVLDIASVSTT